MDRRSLLLVSTLAGMGGLATVASVSVASRAKCVVVNARTGQHFPTLQPAVDATTPGDTLRVKGTCYGDTTVGKSLTIVGGVGATLNGANDAQSLGTVVSVREAATVTITGLTIAGGYQEIGEGFPGFGGGGIGNEGSLTLNDVTVAGNYPRGIYNEGALTLDDSTVADNAGGRGGGIFNEGSLKLNGSSVTRNSGAVGGGIANGGALPLVGCRGGVSLTLNDSSVVDNTAEALGGGIANQCSRSSITLNHSTVAENSAPGIGEAGPPQGGGIDNEGGPLTLNGSTVTHNTTGSAAGLGGGIYGSATLTNSTVSDNTPSGMYIYGATLKNSTVSDNKGIGIDNEIGSLTLTNSTVEGNTNGGILNESFVRVAGSVPGGGTVTLNHSTVADNTALAGGGGIKNLEGSITLNDSTVRGNTAQFGGGIYNRAPLEASWTLTLNDSNVTDNTAREGGGIFNGGRLILNGSSSVRRNAALAHGGGIYNNHPEGATITYGTEWAGTVNDNIPDDIFTA
jgi:hypothetical protein